MHEQTSPGQAGGYPARFDFIQIGEACGDLMHPKPAGDLNGDCKVDLKDLTIFVSSWLDCNDPQNSFCL